MVRSVFFNHQWNLGCGGTVLFKLCGTFLRSTELMKWKRRDRETQSDGTPLLPMPRPSRFHNLSPSTPSKAIKVKLGPGRPLFVPPRPISFVNVLREREG